MSFEEKVWKLMEEIPRGKVTTYGQIARKLNTSAYRAVGNACRKNPYAPRVPCHRVVRSDGTVGGFGGRISGKTVEEKIQRSKDVLKWLTERYDIEKDARRVAFESRRLGKAKTVDDIRIVEGRVAQYYWQAIQSIMPEEYCFESRIIRSHQYNASDPVNLCLNYAYGFLQCECRKAINTVGLESAYGFLHEPSDYQTKEALVYDLQEPFRWIADVAVIEAFESGVVKMRDFCFTSDDYRYYLDIEAKSRFRQFIKDRFNVGVQYKGKTWKWDTIILNKTQELARFLVGKMSSIDFLKPCPSLRRTDSIELRKCIRFLDCLVQDLDQQVTDPGHVCS